MKKIIIYTGLFCVPLWGAAAEVGEKKDEVVHVSKIDASNIQTAIGLLDFMQRAKATQSMPDLFTQTRAGSVLRTVHLMSPLRFEQVYSDLTSAVLTWTEENLLTEETEE